MPVKAADEGITAMAGGDIIAVMAVGDWAWAGVIPATTMEEALITATMVQNTMHSPRYSFYPDESTQSYYPRHGS